MAITNDQLEKALRLKHQQALETRLAAIFASMDDAMVKSVTLTKDTTATTGYAASYTLSVNGDPLPTKIDIPKDWLLSAVTKGTVTAADKAAGGKFENDDDFAVGDKYIDFSFNVKAGDAETTTHIYLNVQDLVDAYLAGNGLALDSSTNTFSVVIDSSNANGLSVGAGGLALAAVIASTSGAGGTNGAMLATDKEKLDGVAAQATKAEVTTEKAGTIVINGTTKTIVEFATDAEVAEVLDAILPAPSNS